MPKLVKCVSWRSRHALALCVPSEERSDEEGHKLTSRVSRSEDSEAARSAGERKQSTWKRPAAQVARNSPRTVDFGQPGVCDLEKIAHTRLSPHPTLPASPPSELELENFVAAWAHHT